MSLARSLNPALPVLALPFPVAQETASLSPALLRQTEETQALPPRVIGHLPPGTLLSWKLVPGSRDLS